MVCAYMKKYIFEIMDVCFKICMIAKIKFALAYKW